MNHQPPCVIFHIKTDGDEFQSASERLYNIYQSLHYIYHLSLSIIQRHIYTDEDIDDVIDDIINCTEVDEVECNQQDLNILEDHIRHDLNLVIRELIVFYRQNFPYFMTYLRFLESRSYFLDVVEWPMERTDVMVGVVTPRYRYA